MESISPMPLESEDENEEFFFESDHLALRGNSDYAAVLRTIAILQAQRIQATKDIDKLALAEKEALEDPEKFIDQIAKGEKQEYPGPINVIELPKINFSKYNVLIPEYPTADISSKTNVNDITVRGRVFDQTKPETFNQLWTCEEQRRLEELLIEYPPEPIEMHRLAKIAKALGNRTTKQVASRVQKFFKKLHAAGMPIPGRLPKSHKSNTNKQGRIYKHGLRPSTFFPAQDVPVTMPEDDDFSPFSADFLYYKRGSMANSVSSFERDNNLVVVDQGSDEENLLEVGNEKRMLKIVQRVKNDKEKDIKGQRGISEHFGYKCDFCNEEPIIGTRWHCATCTEKSIDFCSDCLVTQLKNTANMHPISHKFFGLRITSSQSHSDADSVDGDDDDLEDGNSKRSNIDENSSTNIYDKDYLSQKFTKDDDYNYLDPNFIASIK